MDAGRKSTWAHCESPLQEITPEVLADPAKAPCEIQALALFIFEQRSPATPRRNKILGVSIHREALRADLVLEDSYEHPVEAYSVTHRSLLLDNEEDRKEVALKLLAGSSYKTWRYTREMLAELLESLLAGDHIAPGFQADARSLLLEWRS